MDQLLAVTMGPERIPLPGVEPVTLGVGVDQSVKRLRCSGHGPFRQGFAPFGLDLFLQPNRKHETVIWRPRSPA